MDNKSDPCRKAFEEWHEKEFGMSPVKHSDICRAEKKGWLACQKYNEERIKDITHKIAENVVQSCAQIMLPWNAKTGTGGEVGIRITRQDLYDSIKRSIAQHWNKSEDDVQTSSDVADPSCSQDSKDEIIKKLKSSLKIKYDEQIEDAKTLLKLEAKLKAAEEMANTLEETKFLLVHGVGMVDSKNEERARTEATRIQGLIFYSLGLWRKANEENAK